MTSLNYNEFFNANCYADLKELYAVKGTEFNSKQELETKIEEDWKKISKEQKKLLEENKLPDSPQIKRITVDDTNYTIIGFIHEKNDISQTYKNIIKKEMENADQAYFEQYTNQSVYQPEEKEQKKYIEINDHNELSFSKIFIYEFKNAISHPIETTLDICETNLNAINPKTEDYAKINSSINEIKPLYLFAEEYNNKCKKYNNPILQQTKNTIVEYTNCIQRSAYMSEFVREHHTKKNIAILLGARHLEETSHFLTKGTNNKHIKSRAIKSAKELKTKGTYHKTHAIRKVSNWGKNLGLSIYTLPTIFITSL